MSGGANGSRLFSPLPLRGLTAANRVWAAPMCQYSASDGVPTDWHLVHLGTFAKGGAGLILTEATAVAPEGRISPADTGIWNRAQADEFARINRFVTAHGSIPGIQLAHAGRKGSSNIPWLGRRQLSAREGGWRTIAPSAVPYSDEPPPQEMNHHDIQRVVDDFGAAAARAHECGFQVAEVHAAHGYLLHQFLSPLSNRRTDEYGGDLAGRARFLIETVAAVRAAWPDDLPVFVRISASDWAEGGWCLQDSVALAAMLERAGADLIDVSSGGLTRDQKIDVGPGYQVPFARHIRAASALPVSAVGLITDAAQAEQTLVDGAADAVFLGRVLLREPFWPLRAAKELGAEIRWPDQYGSAKYRGSIP